MGGSKSKPAARRASAMDVAAKYEEDTDEVVMDPNGLPEGWARMTDPEGDPYYVNDDNNINTYDDPRVIDNPTPAKGLDIPVEASPEGSTAGKGEKWTIGSCRDGYAKCPKHMVPTTAIPASVRNRTYNRHMDILPNPKTAVLMPPVDGMFETSYVNANYVRGFNGEPAKFIASMGPLPAQLVPFWRMIWKSAIGSFTITCTKRTIYGTYTHSQFTFERMNQPKRKVDHFWFTAWPDHGVPMNGQSYNCDDVIDFLEMVNASRKKKKIMTPLLVHCSAGVGRTGTFIAMDHVMNTLHEAGKCDALAVINNIRQDRCLLVQHSLQYQWLCSAMVRYAQRQNRPYEVQAPPEAKAATKKKKKAAKNLKAVRTAEKEAAKAKNEAEVGEGEGMVRKSSLRRQSSIIGVLASVSYSGKVYDFAEGDTSGIMGWSVAEEQGMPRELYDAIAGDTTGLLEAASWTDFTVQHMSLGEDRSVVEVSKDDIQAATTEAAAAAKEREETAVEFATAPPEDGDWYVGEMERDAVVSMVMDASPGDFVISKNQEKKYIIYINDQTATLELLVDLSIEDVDVTTELDVDDVHLDEEYMFMGESYTSLGAVVTALRGASIMSEVREGEVITIGDPVSGGMAFDGALGEDTKETKTFARKMSKKHSVKGGARPSMKRPEVVVEVAGTKKSKRKSKKAKKAGPAVSEQAWYVGNASKSKCEKVILTESSAVGTWLVRDGKTDGTYQIVAKDVGGSGRTFLIKTNNEGKFLAFKEAHDSLDSAVEKFKGTKLESKDTEFEFFSLGEPADPAGL